MGLTYRSSYPKCPTFESRKYKFPEGCRGGCGANLSVDLFAGCRRGTDPTHFLFRDQTQRLASSRSARVSIFGEQNKALIDRFTGFTRCFTGWLAYGSIESYTDEVS